MGGRGKERKGDGPLPGEEVDEDVGEVVGYSWRGVGLGNVDEWVGEGLG